MHCIYIFSSVNHLHITAIELNVENSIKSEGYCCSTRTWAPQKTTNGSAWNSNKQSATNHFHWLDHSGIIISQYPLPCMCHNTFPGHRLHLTFLSSSSSTVRLSLVVLPHGLVFPFPSSLCVHLYVSFVHHPAPPVFQNDCAVFWSLVDMQTCALR